MRRYFAGPLSTIEKEVVGEIRAMRNPPARSLAANLLEDPAHLVHHFILSTRGHAQLRLIAVARELGIEMRSLERAFFATFGLPMAQFQIETRLAYARTLLSSVPPTKVSAIAALLGYDEVRSFTRFFKARMHVSPREWGRRERARIADE